MNCPSNFITSGGNLMPAVLLPRLKKQINDLTWKFTRPVEFQAALRELFSYYASRVYKPGKATPSSRLVDSYRVPPLVMKQLELEITPFIMENPEAALAIAEVLWAEEILEPRQLAAIIIGTVPAALSERVIQYLRAWCRIDVEGVSLLSLLERGAQRLRREKPEAWLQTVENWLNSSEALQQAMGVRALLTFVNDREFINLPAIFSLTGRPLQSGASAVQAEMYDLITALSKRSPAETAHFLRQVLSSGANPATIRVIRKVLPNLPVAVQGPLRSALFNLPTIPLPPREEL